MFKRLVVSLALVLPAMALPSQVASAQGPAVGSEAAELLAERPAGEDTLVVVETTRSGRPRVLVQDGIDTRAEAERVLIAADKLRGETVVEWDGTATIAGTSDPRRPEQWGHDAVGAELAWTAATGNGVVVAVLDTGIVAHPDLAGRVLQGRDFIDGDTNPVDGHGHGTHVAGIIAAVANNGIGIAGAAPDATILPIRVLNDSGSGSFSTVATAITWAVDNGADVINMSLGGSTRSSAVTQAIDYALSRNVVVVAAAGNSGPGGAISWPGAEPGALSVAATTSWGEVASFSTRGDYVDVAAPGDRILSTLNTGDYGLMSGTSMASPYVAGLAALVVQANPTWTEQAVRNHIIATAVDMEPAGFDDASGAGLVSFSAAVPPSPWDAPAPTNARASLSGLDVSVTADPVGADGVVGYQLLRNGLPVATAQTPAFVDLNRATVSGTWTYEVRALNSLSQAGASGTATITVATPATPVISVSVSGTTVTLSPASTGSPAPTGWMIYRNGTLLATTATTSPVVLANQALGSHSFAARALAATGISAMSATVSVTIVPAAPGISVQRSGTDTVVTATAVAGASVYEFTRNGSVVSTTSARTFTDLGGALKAGPVTYGVRVTASGLKSDAATISHNVVVPAKPAVSGTVSGTTLILGISAPGASELMVYRDGSLHQTVDATSTLILPAAAGTAATWTVRAATATGVSQLSDPITVTTPVPAPGWLNVTRSGADLVLAAPSVSAARTIQFFRDDIMIGSVRVRGRQVSFTDPGRASIAGTYRYTVRAVSSGGVSSAATTTTIEVVVPATPALSGAASGRSVTLVISAPGATGFEIHRNGRLEYLRSAASAIVLPNEPYGTNVYQVRAVTATGSTGLSAPLTLSMPVPAPGALTIARAGEDISVSTQSIPGTRMLQFFRDGTYLGTGRVERSGQVVIRDAGRAAIPGTYVYSVRAVADGGLNSDFTTRSWTVVTPPTPTVTASVLGQTVTFAISGAGATGLEIRRNGAMVWDSPLAPTVSIGNQPFGTHTYSVRTTSSVGVSAPATVTVAVAFRTVVSVSSWEDGFRVGAERIIGARRYEFYRDGALIGTVTPGSRWPVLTDAGRKDFPGTYIYGAVAIMADGSRSEMGTTTFTVTQPAAPQITGASVSRRYLALEVSGAVPGPETRLFVYSNGTLLNIVSPGTLVRPSRRLNYGTHAITIRLETETGLSLPSNPVTVVAN